MQGNASPKRPGADAEMLTDLMGRADVMLVKKLSTNDRDWAQLGNKHQAGVYIPKTERDSGFFPSLEREMRDAGKPAIMRCEFLTDWPQTGDLGKETKLSNYRSKGEETHMTRLPKAAFSELLPASFLIMGRIRDGHHDARYECLTIDSGSNEADLLADLLDIGPQFQIGLFRPAEHRAAERERVLDFAERVIAAWFAGEIEEFATVNATMPATADLALLARQAWMDKNETRVFDPFKLDAPGDVLREISRQIEWDLFREYQRRERAVELVRLVLGDFPKDVTAKGVIRELIERLPEIDAIMLSASQQRKARAGYSYEHHIEALLSGGDIPFEKQVMLASNRRPDFILPSLSYIDSGRQGADTGLILSAKTTLRERWKQVEREMEGRRLYLTTVDENISGNAIEDMASFGVSLVIPESLLKTREIAGRQKITEYKGHWNVLSFREFCDQVIRPALVGWRAAGA